MKKLLRVFLICVFVMSGIMVGSPAATENDSDNKVITTMEVGNPNLELSDMTNIHEGIAYVKIDSIHEYDTSRLWSDFKIIESMGVKKMVMYLNSPGGDAFAGLALADMIRVGREGGMEIVAEAYGQVASAAIPVFLAAEHRIASKSVIFLIHPAALQKWGMFSETLKDLESQTIMINHLRNKYAIIVSEHSNLSKEKIIEMMGKDTWFTTKEAAEWGMVDKII